MFKIIFEIIFSHVPIISCGVNGEGGDSPPRPTSYEDKGAVTSSQKIGLDILYITVYTVHITEVRKYGKVIQL